MIKKANKYKTGAWNYAPIGKYDIESAVKDWHDLGLNTPMMFNYEPKNGEKKEDVLRCMDVCARYGMKVYIRDGRANLFTLKEIGEDAFRKGLQQANEDFAKHPAFLGFFIGDEPNYVDYGYLSRAYKLCLEYAPNSMPFVNITTYLDGHRQGMTLEEHAALVEKIIVDGNIKALGYDQYIQCAVYRREECIEKDYFSDLRYMGEICRKHNVVFYHCPLCVGHWMYVTPDDDLIHWQFSTMIANGVEGFMWFMLYRFGEPNSFRLSPIQDGVRTEMFERVARIHREFFLYYADYLSQVKLDKVWGFGPKLYGYPAFTSNTELKKLGYVVEEQPLSVSRFVDDDGNPSYVIVNLSQTTPTCLDLEFSDDLFYNGLSFHIAQGEMMLLRNKKTQAVLNGQ